MSSIASMGRTDEAATSATRDSAPSLPPTSSNGAKACWVTLTEKTPSRAMSRRIGRLRIVAIVSSMPALRALVTKDIA
ncbi:hypothetical protein WAI453_007443 [Rhynchosporium graminicola]